MISIANLASAISGRLQLATLRKPTSTQLRAIVRDVDTLRRDLVKIGQKVTADEAADDPTSTS